MIFNAPAVFVQALRRLFDSNDQLLQPPLPPGIPGDAALMKLNL
jgi:hypothetical protein